MSLPRDQEPATGQDLHAVNPILIEVTRGARIESAHRGALAVARSGGLVLALGDVWQPVFPRSAVKAMQALPLVESGAADRFGFKAPELALACASHTGTKRHTATAAAMLSAIGLGESALGCGAHPPLGNSAAKQLVREGGQPTQLHNNCSGKHAGMLATARHLGEPLADYWERLHPVQRRIRETLSGLAEVSFSENDFALDGCSVPTWGLPLARLAAAFARFATGAGLGTVRARAAARLMEACWREPELIAGAGRADTVVMARLPGEVFMKTGAEGVYAGAFPRLGLGFALKIDDGATRASAGTAMALVERLFPEARGLVSHGVIKTWKGAEAGRIVSAPALTEGLDRLAKTAIAAAALRA